MKDNYQRKTIIKQIKNNLIIILSIIILFIMGIITLFNNKTIIKTSKNNNPKALEQEGQTYRLVTSADNVQVPVPKGYVASNVTGENYVSPEYSHTTITHKVSSTPTQLNWSSPIGEQYPWTQDENGIWISGNQGIPSSTSTLESEEFDYIKGTTLTINYTYSGEDCINIYLIKITNNTTTVLIDRLSGNTSTSFDYTTSNYTHTSNNWGTGKYKIRVIYSKSISGDEGQDSAYIKSATYFKEDENGTQTIEENLKTKIHDGGFVIYQYVWVPVENVEDIVRTKPINNGIMQFGQPYIYNYTSIIKETSTGKSYYREPRLVENYDKTKYYLQKHSNLYKRENYFNNMQEDYMKMIESIKRIKGFYIGRYETGDDISHYWNIASFKNPKVVRYNTNIHTVTWYNSYKELERLSGNTQRYVETGMIYDSLFDYTLKWLNETDTRSYEDLAKDSGTWGNYYNNSLKYKTSADGIESTKNVNSEKIVSTGGITEITYKGETYINPPTSSNNIFDIAGNVSELTKSIYSIGNDNRMIRGGTNRQRLEQSG